MKMRTGIWASGLILFGLGLLAVAAWQYFSPDDGPGLTVDETEREISDCSVGQTKVITFPLHNRARHPVQIIGLAPC
jgi:hypothetical protein